MSRKFVIEQIALAPPNPEAAINLLRSIGADEWARDIVVATGFVGEAATKFNKRESEKVTNVAHLAFNYTALEKARELEVLSYAAGENWIEGRPPHVSHFGMHCTESELGEWKDFFKRISINIVQEVNTVSHTNPVIAGKRQYHYTIFGTQHILGVDLKFIVRKDVNAEEGGLS